MAIQNDPAQLYFALPCTFLSRFSRFYRQLIDIRLLQLAKQQKQAALLFRARVARLFVSAFRLVSCYRRSHRVGRCRDLGKQLPYCSTHFSLLQPATAERLETVWCCLLRSRPNTCETRPSLFNSLFDVHNILLPLLCLAYPQSVPDLNTYAPSE